MTNPLDQHPWTRRAWLGGALSLATAPWLAACGGGGDGTATGPTTPTPTPSGSAVLAYGSISGFGSVIVNGVRYDDGQARYRSEDSEFFDRRDLGFGMVARVEGSLGPDGSSGMASVIEVGATLRGPVTAINAGGSFAVLGIPVTSSAATVWADLASPATLAVGQWVEVHGLDGTDGSVTATRVETKPAGVFAIRGPVSAVQGNVVTVRGVTVQWPAGASLPTAGQWVKVRGATTATPTLPLVATEARLLGTRPTGQPVSDLAAVVELEGYVQSVQGTTATVSGVRCDLSTLPASPTGALQVGSRVELHGQWQADGSLRVLRLKLEEGPGEEHGDRHELKGVISAAAGDTLTVLGQTVVVQPGTLVTGGPRTLLVAGTYVEVKGRYVNGQLLASQIEIKASGGSGGTSTSPSYGTVKRKGWVTAVSGTTLVLDGALTVDASQAYVEHGTLAQIRTGVRLEVKGTLDGSGVLRAYKIELDD